MIWQKRLSAFGAASTCGANSLLEDGYFIDPIRGVFALADGFGGKGIGDTIVRDTLKLFREKISSASPEIGVHFPPMGEMMGRILEELNQNIIQWNASRSFESKGGCSILLGAPEVDGSFSLWNCGACSAFMVTAETLMPLLTPQGNLLSAGNYRLPDQSLGMGARVFPEYRNITLWPGQFLGLATGGLAWEGTHFWSDLSVKLNGRLPQDTLKNLAEEMVAAHGLCDPFGGNRSFLIFEKT